MNWYKKHLFAIRKIYVPEDDYNRLKLLVDKMVNGNKNWTEKELELQQTYPEALEIMLREKI